MGKLSYLSTGQMVHRVQKQVRSDQHTSSNEYARDAHGGRMELDRELSVMRERLSSAHQQAKDGTLLSHEEVFQTLSEVVKNRQQEG